MSRIYIQTRPSNNNPPTSSNGAPVRSQVSSSSAISATSQGATGPLRLVKIETSPLSAQAQHTLSLLERQNDWKKKERVEVERCDESSNWETSLSRWKTRRRSEPNYQFKSFDILIDTIDVDQDSSNFSNKSTTSPSDFRLPHGENSIKKSKCPETGNTTAEHMDSFNTQTDPRVQKTSPSEVSSPATRQFGQLTSAIPSCYQPDIVSSSPSSDHLTTSSKLAASMSHEDGILVDSTSKQSQDLASKQLRTNFDVQRNTRQVLISDTPAGSSCNRNAIAATKTSGSDVHVKKTSGQVNDDFEQHQLVPNDANTNLPLVSTSDHDNNEQLESTSAEFNDTTESPELPPPLPSVPPPSLPWTMFPSQHVEEDEEDVEELNFDVERLQHQQATVTPSDSNTVSSDKIDYALAQNSQSSAIVDQCNATQLVADTRRRPSLPISPSTSLLFAPKPYAVPSPPPAVIEVPLFVPSLPSSNEVPNVKCCSSPSPTEPSRSSPDSHRSPPSLASSPMLAAPKRPSDYRQTFVSSVIGVRESAISSDNKDDEIAENSSKLEETEDVTDNVTRVGLLDGRNFQVSGKPSDGTPSNYSGFNSRASFDATSAEPVWRSMDMRRRMTVDATVAHSLQHEHRNITNRKYGFINAAPKPKYLDGNSWIGRSISHEK